MHASLSIRTRSSRAVSGDRRGALASGSQASMSAISVEEEVTCARIALEERYLTLLAARDAKAVDELQRVRVRLHTLAEIAAQGGEARDRGLRDWLAAS
jgi:hypothetical protein